MSPNFGGNNNIGMQNAQQVKNLEAANSAAKKAAAAAIDGGGAGPASSQQFINSIMSQLNGLVAYKIAAGIANSKAGDAGTVQSGGTTITYTNVDGQLTVSFTSAAGSTSITIPSIF